MEQPHRHIKMTIEIEADTMEELAWALDNFSTELLMDYDKGRKPETTQGFSAGYRASFSYTTDVDYSVNGDSYRAAVKKWLEHKKAESV